MPLPIPHARIIRIPETGRYAFEVYFPGRRPHARMGIFESAEAARLWVDPQNERIWEVGPEPGVIAISTGYKPGTVPTRA